MNRPIHRDQQRASSTSKDVDMEDGMDGVESGTVGGLQQRENEDTVKKAGEESMYDRMEE